MTSTNSSTLRYCYSGGIIGYSIGGFYAIIYADRFTRDVAGLILIDSGFAGQMRDQTPEQRKITMADSHRGEERELLRIISADGRNTSKYE